MVIVEAIDRYIDSLSNLRREVVAQDGKALLERFELAREVRKRVLREDKS